MSRSPPTTDRATRTTHDPADITNGPTKASGRMKRVLIPGAAALLGAAILLLPGGNARAADITVPIDTFVDAPIGSLTTLATVPTHRDAPLG